MLTHSRSASAVASALVLAALAGSASATTVEMVYSIAGHTPGHPKTNVPGSSLHFTNFNNRMFRSPTSNLWLVVPTTDGTPATQDQVLVIGSGLTGQLIAREGVTEFAPGEKVDFSTGIPVPRINDAGEWAHACTPQGTGLTGQRVFKASAGPNPTFTLIARTGDAAPALDPGATYGLTMHSPNIDNSGGVGFVASIDNALTTKAVLTSSGGASLASAFVTAPSGQGADGVDPWLDFDTNLFFQSADGAHSIIRGKLNSIPSRDQVAVVDGAVVLQEGFSTISGIAGVVASISDVYMEPDGTWFAQGTMTGGPNWIVRNGVLIASIGAPILPGSSEHWTAFQDVRGSSSGEYVIIGTSDNADALRNNIIVLGRRHVLARESDPIDLDNDGTPESNLFIHSFRDRMAFLNDHYLYFTIRAKSTAAGTSSLGANASLARVLACPANFNADSAVDPDDLSDFIAGYFTFPQDPRVDYNGDGVIDPDDLSDFIGAFFSGC